MDLTEVGFIVVMYTLKISINAMLMLLIGFLIAYSLLWIFRVKEEIKNGVFRVFYSAMKINFTVAYVVMIIFYTYLFINSVLIFLERILL